MAFIIALPAFVFARVPSERIKMSLFRGEKGARNEVLATGITGKLFLAIFATCIVLLIRCTGRYVSVLSAALSITSSM